MPVYVVAPTVLTQGMTTSRTALSRLGAPTFETTIPADQQFEPARIYSVINADGDVVRHWRTIESSARKHFARNHFDGGDYRLIGPTGLVLS